MKGAWQTDGHGSGLGDAAAAELLHAVLITAVVVTGMAVAARAART